MASSPFKTKSFHLTTLDREMLDPERGGLTDIAWWYQAYLGGDDCSFGRCIWKRLPRSHVCGLLGNGVGAT